MIDTTELFGGLLCAVWMDWMCLSVDILVGWFGLVSVSVAPPLSLETIRSSRNRHGSIIL